MTDWSVLGMPANLYRTHYYLARVHADARFDRNLTLCAETLGIAMQLLLYRERRMQSALRMVFVRDGRAEQRENSVAGRLRNVAAVAMHCRYHELQHRVDDRARLLGIKIAHQLRRSLDVGEQRGDGLALAVDRRRSIWLLRSDANLGSR